MESGSIVALVTASAVALILSITLVGCGGGSISTTTTTTTMNYPLYVCNSNIDLKQPQKVSSKGLCIDDHTWQWCSDKMPGMWPNVPGEKIKALRMFRPWSYHWGGDDKRNQTWSNLAKWVTTNNAKVLIGVSVSCNKTVDDRKWKLNLELMRLLGKEHVLGVAIGNEMDLGFTRKDIQPCLKELWDTRYWADLQSRVADMDAMGFNTVKVTSVWSMAILGGHGHPWKEDEKARANTLVTNAWKKWGDRWVWSLNVYSYWDKSLYPKSADDCETSTQKSVAVHYTQKIMEAFRKRIKNTTGEDHNPMWVAENGWSSPMAAHHPAAEYCKQYSSMEAFKAHYENFMAWDLSLTNNMTGPEMAFYFTMRDSNNGGNSEYFGLIGSCQNKTCKIDNSSSTMEQLPDFVM